MSAFQFPLEKVLNWRRTQLEIEQAKLQRLVAQRNALDRVRAELDAASVQTESEVRRWGSIAGGDLAALSAFRRHVSVKEREIAGHRAECEKAIGEQRRVMLEAQRRCRLLERLRERRHTDWQVAVDRDLEQMATESYLARWTRERSA
jgi:flagellar biosynthesis chaperone FliJ